MFTPFSLNLGGRLMRFDRPAVMGIINVTPDSFYASSRSDTAGAVRRRVAEMLSAGVDMIDIGGYSSRPGAADVSVDEELSRLRIGMSALRDVAPEIPVSVDTFRASVAKEAVTAFGADMINDISGGDADEDMFATVADLKVPYILMHMRGTPATMQSMTDYPDGVVTEVLEDLSRKVRRLRLMGVCDLITDPGFGFSKTVEQNYELLGSLHLFVSLLDAPVLAGISRKSMICKVLGINPSEALNATTVLNTVAAMRGASILRVHDVRECHEVVTLLEHLPRNRNTFITNNL